MTFDWINAILATVIFMFPVSALGAILAYVNDHPWLGTLFLMLTFLCIFVLGGMPEEVWQ